jgi:hypothetical protein
MTMLDEFLVRQGARVLAHHGVKGMKWGVRRKSTNNGGDSGSDKTDASSKSGSDSASKSGAESSSSKDTHMSADAEQFVKTHQKQGHEMSDKEIKQIVNRANMVKQYNEIFSPSPNKQLREKVETLQLNKQYSQLHRELHPSAMTRVNNLIKNATKAYAAYKTIDNITGGKLSGQFKNTFGVATGTSKPTTSPGTSTSSKSSKSSPMSPTGPIWVQTGAWTTPRPPKVIEGQVIRRAITA